MLGRLLERLPFVQRIYGDTPTGRSPYMTRVMLTPRTKRGQLLLHWFHRGDSDPHPHDHPWDFWTMPLNRAYCEEELSPVHPQAIRRNWVPRWRWSFRPGWHTHRVIGPIPLVTLVWRTGKQREWGFWVTPDDERAQRVWGQMVQTGQYEQHRLIWVTHPGRTHPTLEWVWVPWRDYVS